MLKLRSRVPQSNAIAGLLFGVAVVVAVGCGTSPDDEAGDTATADDETRVSAGASVVGEAPAAKPSESGMAPSSGTPTPLATAPEPEPSPAPPAGGAVSVASNGDLADDVVLIRPEYSADVIEAMPDFGR